MDAYGSDSESEEGKGDDQTCASDSMVKEESTGGMILVKSQPSTNPRSLNPQHASEKAGFEVEGNQRQDDSRGECRNMQGTTSGDASDPAENRAVRQQACDPAIQAKVSKFLELKNTKVCSARAAILKPTLAYAHELTCLHT